MDDNLNHNAIFYATQAKDEQKALQLVEWLIEMGVNASVIDSLNQSPLFYACRDGKSNLIDIFVKCGCDPNQLDTYGQSSIFYAAREGHVSICKKLFQNGADCD
jgi:ankyrin repeat protein